MIRESIVCDQCSAEFPWDENVIIKDDTFSRSAAEAGLIAIEDGFTNIVVDDGVFCVKIEGHFCNTECLKRYVKDLRQERTEQLKREFAEMD